MRAGWASGSPLFTDNEGSVGDLSLSDNGTLLSLSGWTAANGGSAENAILSRGAGTLDSNGNYTLAATYTGVSGNQPRSAYSPDDGQLVDGGSDVELFATSYGVNELSQSDLYEISGLQGLGRAG